MLRFQILTTDDHVHGQWTIYRYKDSLVMCDISAKLFEPWLRIAKNKTKPQDVVTKISPTRAIYNQSMVVVVYLTVGYVSTWLPVINKNMVTQVTMET